MYLGDTTFYLPLLSSAGMVLAVLAAALFRRQKTEIPFYRLLVESVLGGFAVQLQFATARPANPALARILDLTRLKSHGMQGRKAFL